MRLELDKRYGPALVNLLRQAAMTAIPVLRPIAFSVGQNSNVIDTCDSAVEDMTTFIHNVMNQVYFTKMPEMELFRVNKNVTASLQTSDFISSEVECRQNAVVLHVLGSTNVQIYFRLAAGNYSAKENVAYLRSKNIETDSLVVVPSRHCAVDACKLQEHEDEFKYVVDVSVSSQVMTEYDILTKAWSAVAESVTKIGNLLENS